MAGPSSDAATWSPAPVSETESVTVRAAAGARSAVSVKTASPPSATEAALAAIVTTGGGRSSSRRATVSDAGSPAV